MAIRFLLQCVSLARIHFTSVKQDANQQDLRIIKDKINPFSFFRNIYINPMLHSAEEQRAIIAHEKVHAKEWHTADILAGEDRKTVGQGKSVSFRVDTGGSRNI